MKRRSILAIGVALLLALSLLAVACGSDDTESASGGETATTETAGTETTAAETSAAPTGEPIKVGAVVSATGPAAPLGEPERAALQMLQDKYNAAGGVLGRPLEIIIEDDQSNPNEAVKATNKLIQQDQVVAVLGGTISPSTLAMKPITAREQIPHITMSAANAITDEPPIDWIWRTPPKDALAAARALTYVSETLGATKVAVLHDENAFGSSGADEIQKTAGDYGLEVVGMESYKTDDTDMTSQLTKLKGANPDVLIVWGTNPGPAVAAKNMQDLGMDIPYVGSHGIANKTFIDLAGPAAEGVVFPAGKLLIPDSIDNPDQKAVVDEFIADYEAATGDKPNTFAGHAYDSVGLLVQAIEKAGGTDPAGIQAALNSTQGFVGPDGIYNYSVDNHDGLSVDDMIMVKIENGEWVLAQ